MLQNNIKNGTSKNIKFIEWTKFVTRKCNIVIDNSKASYDSVNEITYNTEVLISNLCDYDVPYILVKVDITVTAAAQTQVACKNCVSFTKCISNMMILKWIFFSVI